MLKRLDELSKEELKNEFKKADLEGNFQEAECIIRLTVYLVKVLGKDPFSFRLKIDEEIKNKKDLEVEYEVVPSCWPAEGLSVETSSVSLPETLPILVGSSLKSKDVRSTSLSSSCLDDPVSTWGMSMSTLLWSVGSSLMSSISFPSSSYRAVHRFSKASGEPQTFVLMKKWIGESEEDSNFQISQSFRPVVWPPDMCSALRQQHLGISCTQHIYCSSC